MVFIIMRPLKRSAKYCRNISHCKHKKAIKTIYANCAKNSSRRDEHSSKPIA